jgi:Flp pilus assembly protein TadD
MKSIVAVFALGCIMGFAFSQGIRNFGSVTAEETSPELPEDPAELIELGKGQIALGDFAAAQNTFLLAGVIDSKNPEIHRLTGEATLLAGSPALAIGYFERAIALDKSNAATWNGLGTCLEETGQPDRAQVAYDRAVQMARISP